MIPKHKAKQAHHILKYYKTWNDVKKHSIYKDGIYTVKLPLSVREAIENDPECQPSKQITLWQYLFGQITYIGKKQ